MKRVIYGCSTVCLTLLVYTYAYAANEITETLILDAKILAFFGAVAAGIVGLAKGIVLILGM